MSPPLAATGAVVAVSVAVATAVAIYESPELRRYADDVRRRIALALHSIGDGINPPHREPLFNRPEDAEGFLQSRRGQSAEPGVDADDETRRRQREELMYWNSVRLQKQEKERTEREVAEDPAQRLPAPHRGTSFDDFLRPDQSGEQGTYVFNTGTDVHSQQDGLRRRGDGARGFTSSLYANPFADENFIDRDDAEDLNTNIAPGRDEIMSDIYSATTRDPDEHKGLEAAQKSLALIDIEPMPSQTASSATLERDLGPDEYMTAGQENRSEAYASIQAWAENSRPDFYSPLPVTPEAPLTEPELVSDGELTPTDSISLAGSGEDIANDVRSSVGGDDVISESDGMATPASWSEVGSVISENEPPMRV